MKNLDFPLNYCVTLYYLVIFHSTNIIQFVYSPVHKHLDCFQFFAIINNIAFEHLQTGLCGHLFLFLWWMPRQRIAGSNGKHLFNSLRSCHTVFLQDCSVFHSHHQGMNVPLTWLTSLLLFYTGQCKAFPELPNGFRKQINLLKSYVNIFKSYKDR